MKRKISIIAVSVILIILSVIGVVAFSGKGGSVQANVAEERDGFIVIQIEKTDGDATLLDAMNALAEKGKLSFVIENGMVMSINGKENQTVSLNEGYSWMLYTSDESNANTAWGTCEYGGTVYGSAVAGANMLKVVEGGYYIWSYDQWSF